MLDVNVLALLTALRDLSETGVFVFLELLTDLMLWVLVFIWSYSLVVLLLVDTFSALFLLLKVINFLRKEVATLLPLFLDELESCNGLIGDILLMSVFGVVYYLNEDDGFLSLFKGYYGGLLIVNGDSSRGWCCSSGWASELKDWFRQNPLDASSESNWILAVFSSSFREFLESLDEKSLLKLCLRGFSKLSLFSDIFDFEKMA